MVAVAANVGGGEGGARPSLPTPELQPLLNTAVRHRLDIFGRAAGAALCFSQSLPDWCELIHAVRS